MYDSNFFHDAQLTCTQVSDLLVKSWRPGDDTEYLRNVLQDLLGLKEYFSRMELDAEEVKQGTRPAVPVSVLNLAREAEVIEAIDERISHVEASLRS